MKGARSDQGPLPQIQSWAVPADQRPLRLDSFVHRCLPHLSLREIQKAIGEKAIWINGRAGKKGGRVFAGDVLTLQGFNYLLDQYPLPGWDLKLPILYEDAFVLAVDKPAGMDTHPHSGRKTKTVANFLAAIRPSLCGVGKSRWEPGLVHRLDRDTSGVILAAKDQASFDNLSSQFRRRVIEKRYWALVWGRTDQEGIVDLPLGHDPRDRRKMRAVTTEKKKKDRTRRWKALTKFRNLGYSQGFSLLQVEMKTGVTHQIRVHLQAIRHPLVGDPLYGEDQSDPFGLGRQFLHAVYLGFTHPKSGQNTAIESPLSEELQKILNRLRMEP